MKVIRKILAQIILLSLLGVVGLALVEPVAARQQGLLAPPEIPGEAVYVPFPVKIKLDGKLDDWKDVPVQVVTKGSPPSKTPGEDSPLSFAVAADNEHFYLTMSIVDKNIVTGQHDTSFWNEDSLEFFLNTSGDLNAAAYGDGIFQLNINPGDIGNTDPAKLTVTGQNLEQTQVTGFVFRTADGWGFEVALPLKVKPTHGLEIGFQAQSNGASQRDRDSKLIWSNADTADNSWQYPYLFGRAFFFEVGRTDIPKPSPHGAPPTAALAPTPSIPLQQISINQVGYYAQAAKVAVLVSGRQTPLDWALKNSGGQTVLTGKTEVKDLDPAAGDAVHWIDFSAYATPGKGYTLTVEKQTSDPFEIGETLYSTLKLDALRYFYLNRSGIALEQPYAGEWARPAGHLTDNQVTCYAGPDSTGKEWPACDYTLDASRGWYDAGDYGKYVVNAGIAEWTLLDAYERNPGAFADKALNIPESGNGVPDILDEARWEMDFLLGMQVPAGQPLAGMAHHKLHGLQWDAMPAQPPTQSKSRFLFPPSTAATLNLAATAAQCARIWKSIDADFAARCLTAAETAWQAAQAHPAMLAAEFPLGGGGYGDNDVSDEFYWAAAELYVTTGKAEYQKYYTSSSQNLSTKSMYWGGGAPLGTISLAVAGKDAAAQAAVVKAADEIMARMQESANGYLSPVPANGYFWGSNSDVLNRSIMLALAYDFTGQARYLNAVAESMNYLLGRNPLNFSYISGYGTRSLAHPHHRFWGNQPTKGYPPPPPGVIAGGPNAFPDDDAARAAGLVGRAPEKSYVDQMGSYSTNEVAINWNAPLAWVAAYLDDTARPLLSETQPAAASTAIPTATPIPTPTQPGASPVPWGWMIGAMIVLALIVVAAVVLRRRRKP